MEQYVSKSALVAEIERRKKLVSDPILSGDDLMIGERNALFNLLSFIDTLEVKEVQEPAASDKGMVEEIIINLKRVEQDYHIDLTREMTWLRNKAQKGE